MEASYVELAEKLAGSGMLGNLDLTVMEKAFAQQELQLGSFPTILFFPKHAFGQIKYSGDLCELVLSYQARKQVIHEIRVFLHPGKPLTSAQI